MMLSVRAAVLHVRSDAAGPETNGVSWATAFNTITQALQYASTGDELWVAEGTYRGGVDIPRGVALYGGFAGTETARTQRDWGRNRTVIDWDEWGDEYPPSYFEFKSVASIGAGSRVDGFTLLNGWNSYGAGVYASEPGATIANNIIVTNRATGIFGSAVLVDSVGEFDRADDFFLRTANDLLRLQFPFGATNIPVTAYGPTVHRLLQVAANVYDAAHSNAFPSVFRPQFTSTPEGAIISGYYRDDSAATVDDWVASNPYGIPMIIGARKGFPNFNELFLQTSVVVARRLELRRLNTNAPPYQTNQMYIIGISNFVGVEAWNSYTQAFGHDIQMQVSNVCSYVLTSGPDIVLDTRQTSGAPYSLSVPGWPGFADPTNPERMVSRMSFRAPLYTNRIVLSNSVFRFSPPFFVPTNHPFESGLGFRIPDWRLSISNRLTFVLSSGGRIVDFVLLPNLTNTVDLNQILFGNHIAQNEGIIARSWATNRPGTNINITTEGIQAQIDISLGNPQVDRSQWEGFNFDSSDMSAQIGSFQQFVFPTLNRMNTNLVQTAPFSPARKLVLSAVWEANDPLVHTMAEHLKSITNNYRIALMSPWDRDIVTNQTLGYLNGRFEPWRGHPKKYQEPADIDSRLRDRGVTGSDEFDFPTAPDVNIRWLDHIHRGTPWQTLYFDRSVAPAVDWAYQSLDPLSHPTNDWKIIEYLRSRLRYEHPVAPTRILNNTIVGNEGGGLLIATNANAVLLNNAVVYNSSGLLSEGSAAVEFSRNCVFGNSVDNNGDVSAAPQFVPGDFSAVGTSPLIDAGNNAALTWVERPVLGNGTDIGALEFGPDGVPAFSTRRTGQGEHALELRGYPGQSYVIEGSTNLVRWDPVGTNIAEMGSVLVRDALGTNYSHRFYRAMIAK